MRIKRGIEISRAKTLLYQLHKWLCHYVGGTVAIVGISVHLF